MCRALHARLLQATRAGGERDPIPMPGAPREAGRGWRARPVRFIVSTDRLAECWADQRYRGMREEGRIFQFPCNRQLPAQVCGSGGAGFSEPMPVHPQTALYGPLQRAGHRNGSPSAAGRAPRRLERVFSTGFAVMQDANNYGRPQIFPCGPLIPHTGIWVR